MKYAYLLIVLAFGCKTKNVEIDKIDTSKADSVIMASKSLHDSSDVLLKAVEQKTQERVEQAITKMVDMDSKLQSLDIENKQLKDAMRVTKATIIRDTIIITEKKNFWGRTKTKVDSSSSTDTIIIED